MRKDRHNAEAYIRRGRIVIDLEIDGLPAVYEGGVDCGYIEPGFKVTDPRTFARDVVRALNHEDEQGTTAIHRLFDAAFGCAIEDGAEGVEEDPVCPDCQVPLRICGCTPRRRRPGREG
jgi:hypothetical protein